MFHSQTIEGYVYIGGEVRGTWGARPTGEVRIDATFLGTAGETVGTDFTYALGHPRRAVSSRTIDDTTLVAGENGCFLIFTELPFVTFSRAFARVSWGFSRLEALRGNVVVEGAEQDADASGNLVLRGRLRNAGAVATYLNNVVIALRDSENRVGWCDFEFVQGSLVLLPSGDATDTGLAPGQVGSFINYSPAVRSTVAGVDMWAAWEEADGIQATATTRLSSWHRLVADVKAVPALDAAGRARMRNAAIQRLRAINGNDER